MIFFIIAAIILVLFIGFIIALCLCKESIIGVVKNITMIWNKRNLKTNRLSIK